MNDPREQLQKREPMNGTPQPAPMTHAEAVATAMEKVKYPLALYVTPIPGAVGFVYAGSTDTAEKTEFFTRYLGIYGSMAPEKGPRDVEQLKEDFRTKRSAYEVRVLPDYIGDAIRRARGQWVEWKRD